MDSISKERSILIFDDRANFQKLIGLNAFLYLGRDIIFQNDMDDALNFIKENRKEIGLVLSKQGRANMAEKLRSRMTIEGHTIPVIAIREEANGGIFNQETLKDVLRASAIILNISAKKMASGHEDDKYSYDPKLLPIGVKTNCPLYIKNKDGEYRVYIHPDKIITYELVSPLVEKGEKIYIDAKKRLRLGSFFTQQLLKIVQSEELPLEEKSSALDHSQQIIQDQARKIGIDDETLEWAKVCIDELCSEITEIPKISTYFLEKILKRPLSYRYRSSFLTNVIAIHMLRKSTFWDKQLATDITSVSFMRDLALTKDDFIKIRCQGELGELRATKAEKRTIEFHSRVAYEFLKDVPYFTQRSLELVKSHHGSMSGIGFNKSLHQIDTITAAFVIAEEWTSFILNFENRPIALSRDKIMTYLQAQYPDEIFAEPMSWLKDLNL